MSCESFHHTDFDFCTNLLIMSSSSDDVVLQKKKDEELVNWREYEALKSHLTRVFTNTTDAIDKNLQDMNMRLDQHVGTVDTIQTQVATLNVNVTTLQRSIEGLTAALHRREDPQHDDAFDDFDEGSAVDAAPHVGRGRAIPPVHAPAHGRGFAQLGSGPRVPNQAADDGLGKPKLMVPLILKITSHGS